MIRVNSFIKIFLATSYLLAGSSHLPDAQNTGECDQFSAGYLLRCVGPLLHYAKYNVQPKIGIPGQQVASSNHSSSNRTMSFGDGVCHLYKDYKTCAPAELRRKCSNLIATLESVYDYVCSSNVLKHFSAHLDCLLEVDSHDPGVLNCEQNATESLRQIASSTDKSGDERVDRQCDAVQQYFYCMMDKYLNTCGQEAWQLKVDITKRSTSVELANCSFVTTPKPQDFTKPKCRDDGVCLCHSGYKLKDNSTCEDIDECLQPGLCSQTCRNEPGTFACLCDEKYYEKSVDGRRCIRKTKNDSQPYLFFAHGQSIWNITLDGKDFQLKKASLQKTAMLDLDVEDRMIYYVDIGANKLERIRFEGVFPQTLQSYDIEGTEGIAIDWMGRKLYSARNTDIFVQELDGTYRKALYKNVFKLPRALVADPLKGYLFATDWGTQAFIARADMDGGDFRIIVKGGLTWPNALAVDYYAEKIYWADAFADIIETSDFNGENRRTVLKDSNTIPHIFGLTVLDDYLYWTDWTYRGILRASKFNGDNVTVVTQTALLPYGIKAYYEGAQPKGKNPCGENNGDCQQLCLVSPHEGNGTTSYKCSCADGSALSTKDNKTCESDCPKETHFLCGGSGSEFSACISKKYWCDNVAQCSDKSDEDDCPPRICQDNQFQCHKGRACILDTKLCDGRANCDDSSDEKYCSSS